jgi:hypothetical protein
MMKGEDRRAARVRLEHRYPVNLMGADGTWRRACFLLDVSDTGAKIEVEGSIDVLKAREFFLVLSSTGLAYRRCELIWIDGSTAGVRFVSNKPSKKANSGNERH